MLLCRDGRRGLTRDLQIAHHRLQIAHEFARDGHHGDLRATPQGQSMIQRVHALLRRPGVPRDRGRLAALPHGERGPDFRMEAIGPRRLHQHVSALRMARRRDGAASFPWATGMFARDEAEIRHHLARRVTSPPIDERRGQHHRAVALASAKTRPRRDRRRIGRCQCECRNVVIEGIAPRQFVFEQREVLAENDLIFRGEGRRRTG